MFFLFVKEMFITYLILYNLYNILFLQSNFDPYLQISIRVSLKLISQFFPSGYAVSDYCVETGSSTPTLDPPPYFFGSKKKTEILDKSLKIIENYWSFSNRVKPFK